jgi:WD40 repeat protein
VEIGVSVGQPMQGDNDSVTSIAFSSDGKQIASGSWDKTIELWNVEMGAGVGKPMEGHNGHVTSIAFSPDGKQIASSSWDKTI